MGRSGNVDGIWSVRMFSYHPKTEMKLNVIPQPQEVSQDIQAHPFVINPQTGIVSIRKAMKSCNGRQNF